MPLGSLKEQSAPTQHGAGVVPPPLPPPSKADARLVIGQSCLREALGQGQG